MGDGATVKRQPRSGDVCSATNRAGSFRIDSWESALLGYTVLKGELLSRGLAPDALAAHVAAVEDEACPVLSTLRVEESDVVAIRACETSGYRLIEVYLTFHRALDRTALPARPQPEVRIRDSVAGDTSAVVEIARTAFTYDRLHADPEVSNDAATLSREKWAENSCLGRADKVLISEKQGRLTGFCACRIDGDAGVIDLMAVSGADRGSRVGQSLVVAAIDFFVERDLGYAAVATQGKNVPAVRLYEKCDFRLRRSQLTYHKHSGNSSGA